MSKQRTQSRPQTQQAMHAVFFSLFLLGSTGASALQPLVTDDTGTQGVGGNQLEASFSRVETGAGDKESGVPLVYTRGITNTLDVFIEKARLRLEPFGATSDSGWGNTVIGAKWRFIETEGLGFAFKPVFSLPVNANDENVGLGAGKTSLEATLIASQELNWGAVHANLVAGTERFRDPANDTDSLQFSLAPVVNINDQFIAALDFGLARSETGATSAHSRFAEIGVVYMPSEALEFALGVIRSRERSAGTSSYVTELTGGMTWRFK